MVTGSLRFPACGRVCSEPFTRSSAERSMTCVGGPTVKVGLTELDTQ